MNLKEKNTIMITCARGLSPWLRQELEELGYDIKDERKSGIEIEGNIDDAMFLNLRLRSAYCIQYLAASFKCTDIDTFYKELRKVWWERVIPPDEYLCVISRTDTEAVNNTMFANQRAKDAIVDRIVEKTGRRPDSGPDRTGVVVNVYWYGEDCWVYLNTTGQKLSDRGYRKMPHKAPLQEALAASIIMATGYDGTQDLVLPMCGSGTLPIEAALIAQKRTPGLLRSNYAFMHYNNFDSEKWMQYRAEAKKESVKTPGLKILATDIDPVAIVAARQNAQTAGVDHLIEFGVCDFANTRSPEQGGIVLMNPEYGYRLGEEKELVLLYSRIGDYFKQKCPGTSGYVFTGNLDLAKQIG